MNGDTSAAGTNTVPSQQRRQRRSSEPFSDDSNKPEDNHMAHREPRTMTERPGTDAVATALTIEDHRREQGGGR